MRWNFLFGCAWCCLLGFQAPAQKATTAPQRFSYDHPQMGTLFRVVFYADLDTAQAAAYAVELFRQIDSLNAVFSDWMPESELNRLCSNAGTSKPVSVSEPLFDILERSVYFSRKSDGAFDATVGPLTRLWRRARSFHELPVEEKIVQAREKVGWKSIRLYRKLRQVSLMKAGMALDLGGIAQGWTADYCLKWLAKHGITAALVDAGGDIALGKAPPGENGWQIEIPELNGEKRYLQLSECGITTSGATYRYLEIDGKRYSHIVDPRSGWALTHRMLVTVKAPNATTADAWATALSVSGEKGKKKALKSDRKLDIWLTQSPL